jgi:sialate O-acetylesterase
MVVTTDIGNPNDIHPTNKKEVGKRLANIALHELMGKDVIYNGPSFDGMEIKGNQVLVTFKDVADGLKTKGNSEVLGFEIAGADQVFYPAQAQIVDQKVVVYSDQVAQPMAVRFGWLGDDSACNLFNSVDLPAVPFRTDAWKTLTKGIKYKL